MLIEMLVKMKYLGLGKNIYNSNVTELTIDDSGSYEWTTCLTERLMRKKGAGDWPKLALEKLDVTSKHYEGIAENRDITTPKFMEDLYQKKGLFYELIKNNKLDRFCSHFNKELQFIPHHLAHAFSAMALMPYQEALILVMDGGGSALDEYKNGPFERFGNGMGENIEHTTLFHWNGSTLEILHKEVLQYRDYSGITKKLSEGIGSYYEKMAELIFNDNLSSGKVMGLAAFGQSNFKKEDNLTLQRNIDWSKSFKGQSKKEWQESPDLNYWKDQASTVQEAFETNLMRVLTIIEEKSLNNLPLVFTGGCALNCTANYKLYKKKVLPEIFIPPNPGDEGISLGLSFGKAYIDHNLVPQVRGHEIQTSAFGIVEDWSQKKQLFKDFYCYELKDFKKVAEILKSGEVVAWFQGRSECGPRALGHRSLLVRPDRSGVKDELNRTIKFREDFRPYGATILWEEGHNYFAIEKGFQNPFMSFATPVNQEHRELLKEVTHIDGTCRMQTIMKSQNDSFYSLIKICFELGMPPLLLNTSLNIMGEPIVESPEDALNFLSNSVVKYLVFNDVLISKVVLR